MHQIAVTEGEVYIVTGPIYSDQGRAVSVALAGRKSTFKAIYVPSLQLALLLVPGSADPEVHARMMEVAEALRVFAILDLPADAATASAAIAWAETHAPPSHLAAAYFPRIRCTDPAQNAVLLSFPNSGAMAGVFARTDANAGP